MEDLLELEHISKGFPKFRLNNVSFKLKKGCIMGFVGENGAGKTTVIKLILNAIKKDKGSIRIFGLEHEENEIEVKSKIGYVPAEDYFTANSTLEKHAKMISNFYETWDEELFKAICKVWHLPLEQKLYEYSKGMKTKAMLALALARRPQLLILDEPTLGLDSVARIEVLDIIRQFVENGERSVLMSTHTTTDLDKIADYITLIHQGEIKESLSVNEIEEKYALVQAGIEVIQGKEEAFIGLRKGKLQSEGLMLRSTAEMLFSENYIKRPTVENLLVYTIWGDKDEKSQEIIKGL